MEKSKGRRTKRVDITMTTPVLSLGDFMAQEIGMSRSEFIEQLILEKGRFVLGKLRKIEKKMRQCEAERLCVEGRYSDD